MSESKNTTTLYEIRLIPYHNYCFNPGKGARLGNKQEYYKTSQELPQQSTVLGLLRHQLLYQNGGVHDTGAYNCWGGDFNR